MIITCLLHDKWRFAYEKMWFSYEIAIEIGDLPVKNDVTMLIQC